MKTITITKEVFNVTLNPHHDQHSYKDQLWFQILRVTALSCFILFGAYIVWALIVYEQSVRRSTRNRGSSKQMISSLAWPSKSGQLQEWLKAVDTRTLAAKMRLCSIASPLCATLLFVAQLIYELLHIFTDEIHVCEIMTNLIFTLLTWSTVFIYLLLWLRQRSIYTNSAEHLTTTTMKTLSLATLMLIFLDAFLVPIFFGVGRHFIRNKCHVKSNSYLHFYYIIVTSFLSIVFHVSLLYLFATPLLRHTSARSNILRTETLTSQQKGSSQRLLKVTRRACYVTLYGVIVDVSIILSTATLSSTNEKLQALLEDAILLSGVVTVMLTFVNWRERLFPLGRICNNKPPCVAV